MNAIEILKNDHQQLIAIMDDLNSAADKQAENCDELFQKFKDIFHQHDKAEDEVFYPAIKQYAQLDKLARKGYQAHHIVEVGILELRLFPYTSDSWWPKFSVVQDSILSHISEEENSLFPQVASLLSEDDLNRLGNGILKQRERIK